MKYLVFNIETIPDANIPQSLIPVPDDFDAPANWKDPAKIAEFKAEKVKEEMAKMSLSPLTGYIVCYTEIYGDTDTIGVLKTLSLPSSREEDIVKHFFSRVAEFRKEGLMLFGYNSKSFDYPFLVMKGIQHGVVSSQDVMLHDFVSKYIDDAHFDIYLYLSGFESRKKGKLSQWGERLGCKEKVFGSGDLVGPWYEAGDIQSIVRHCESNVKVTYELALKLVLERMRIEDEKWRAAGNKNPMMDVAFDTPQIATTPRPMPVGGEESTMDSDE